MPYTSYALLKGIRSHRITVPNAQSGFASACLQCHQDRDAAFGPGHSTGPKGSAPPESRSVLASILLSGDAAGRALAAFHLSRDPMTGRTRSSPSWQTLLLAEALKDPYAVVRFMAHRGLHSIAELSALPFDFVAPERVRNEQALAIQDRASRIVPAPNSKQEAYATFRNASGQLDEAAVRSVAALRNDTPVRIAE